MKFYKLIIPKGFRGSAAELSGGCGSDGALFDYVPDNFLGVDISLCCKIHDYLYTIGLTEEDKVLADKMFYKNLVRCVENDSPLIFKTTNLWLAKKYYQAVRDFGADSFWDGKQRPVKSLVLAT